MKINEFEAYKSEVQRKMNGMKNHEIMSKLAGIEGLVIGGYSEQTHIAVVIEKEKANINMLLRGISTTHFGKSKEFTGYTTIGA